MSSITKAAVPPSLVGSGSVRRRSAPSSSRTPALEASHAQFETAIQRCIVQAHDFTALHVQHEDVPVALCTRQHHAVGRRVGEQTENHGRIVDAGVTAFAVAALVEADHVQNLGHGRTDVATVESAKAVARTAACSLKVGRVSIQDEHTVLFDHALAVGVSNAVLVVHVGAT